MPRQEFPALKLFPMSCTHLGNKQEALFQVRGPAWPARRKLPALGRECPAAVAFPVVEKVRSFKPCGVHLWLESRAEIMITNLSYRLDSESAKRKILLSALVGKAAETGSSRTLTLGPGLSRDSELRSLSRWPCTNRDCGYWVRKLPQGALAARTGRVTPNRSQMPISHGDGHGRCRARSEAGHIQVKSTMPSTLTATFITGISCVLCAGKIGVILTETSLQVTVMGWPGHRGRDFHGPTAERPGSMTLARAPIRSATAAVSESRESSTCMPGCRAGTVSGQWPVRARARPTPASLSPDLCRQKVISKFVHIYPGNGYNIMIKSLDSLDSEFYAIMIQNIFQAGSKPRRRTLGPRSGLQTAVHRLYRERWLRNI